MLTFVQVVCAVHLPIGHVILSPAFGEMSKY